MAEDFGFLSHRLPMALAAKAAGFDVGIITRVNDQQTRAQIESKGFKVFPINWQRSSINPIAALTQISEIAKIFRRERPDIIHNVALKPIIWGTLAALQSGVQRIVNAPVGLGYIFTSDDMMARALRLIVAPMLRVAMRNHRVRVIIQNGDDWQSLARDGIIQHDRSMIIRGSGVELEKYNVMPEPDGPITIGVAARMLHDKGILPLVEAQQKLQNAGMDVRLLLAGTPDPENRATLTADEMAKISALPGVTALGHVTDIPSLWARCHIAVLPSRREGLPKALLEAAAAGRPLIATDVPGCREICHDSVNGILVPMDDAAAMAAAIKKLAEDENLRKKYGAASRAMVETDVSAAAVGAKLVGLYRQMMTEIQ
ncbi:MAG TPA: glycosyltransferase family 1 protein [Rhodospirillaceae bacterium]|nr:glycosyltransferase family 1 protein [Rhodospirillaceae bacterium]